jgi:hypothetical protein
MARIIPPQGLREISVETKKGTRVLRAGKDGLFNVENPKLARKLKEEEIRLVGHRVTRPASMHYNDFNFEVQEEIYSSRNKHTQYPYEEFYLDNKHKL